MDFISPMGNGRAGSAFVYGASGQTGQTDDTKEVIMERASSWGHREVQGTEEAAAAGKKRGKKISKEQNVSSLSGEKSREQTGRDV